MKKMVQVVIPVKCHENWENMSEARKGRFCAVCEKVVVDFSAKEDEEIFQELAAMNHQNVCGNFFADQLNRPLIVQNEQYVGSTNLRQVLLGASLATLIMSVSHAQQMVIRDYKEQPRIELPVIDTLRPKVMLRGDTIAIDFYDHTNETIVNGIVQTANGLPLNNARVQLINASNFVLFHFVTDANGQFSIPLNWTLYPMGLVVEKEGFERNILMLNEQEKLSELVIAMKGVEQVKGNLKIIEEE